MNSESTNKCPACHRDTRTYTPAEHEIRQSYRKGQYDGMRRAAGLVRQCGLIVLSRRVAEALEYAAEAYRT